MLVQIAFDEAELCHDRNQNAFASVQVDGHWETWPVRSRGFRLWLRRRLREEQDRSAYSDALSTGEGFATRALYTDQEEVIFESQRPVMFNGITDLATRSDLLDRSLLVTLAAIPEDQRKAERTLWAAFDAAKPKILGALLDAVVVGLANEQNVKLDRVPRMADFALWVTACESGLGWPPGTFLEAYTANRASANDTAIEASLVGVQVQSFMACRESWQGTSSELLAELGQVADDATRKRRDWPKSARKLSGDLRRIAPNLRAAGIDVGFRRSGKRLIFLGRRPVGFDAGDAEPSKTPLLDKPSGEKTLQPGMDGVDCIDGGKQAATESDAAFGHSERMAICTIHGGLSENAAEAVAKQQFGDATNAERNSRC